MPIQVKFERYSFIRLTDFYLLSSQFDLSDLASEIFRTYILIPCGHQIYLEMGGSDAVGVAVNMPFCG